jgi:hypothetical protein
MKNVLNIDTANNQNKNYGEYRKILMKKVIVSNHTSHRQSLSLI